MAEVVDLRGREVTITAAPVLSDPTGRRARVLARGGRAMAVLALLWVATLLLAGLGVLPAGDVPLGRVVASSPAPPALRDLPAPSRPSADDLRPAAPANAAASPSRIASLGPHQSGPSTSGQSSASSATAAKRTISGAGTGARGVGAAAVTSGSAATTGRGHANAPVAPGHNKTTAPGNSASAPGQLRGASAPATTGKSGLAPGRMAWPPTDAHPKLP